MLELLCIGLVTFYLIACHNYLKKLKEHCHWQCFFHGSLASATNRDCFYNSTSKKIFSKILKKPIDIFPECGILKPSKGRRLQAMTKNINATYSVSTKRWTIRDNGQILVEGQGVLAYAKALNKIKDITTKPIRQKTVN